MEDAAPVRAQKVAKESRLSYRDEMNTIKQMPRLSRFILIMKVAGVAFFAIGLEGLVSGRIVLAVSFLALGVFVSFLPIKVKINVCARCGRKLDIGQALCPACGVPNM